MHVIFGIHAAIKKLKPNEKVCYLGYDFSKQLILIKSGLNVCNIKSLISDSAHSIKSDFINYITDIGKKQKNALKWWASRIASKSNLQTDFFANVCLLITFSEIEKKIFVQQS